MGRQQGTQPITWDLKKEGPFIKYQPQTPTGDEVRKKYWLFLAFFFEKILKFELTEGVGSWYLARSLVVISMFQLQNISPKLPWVRKLDLKMLAFFGLFDQNKAKKFKFALM